MRKFSACCQHSSLSGITMSELAGSSETSPYHARLLMLKKAVTKVVRPRSDRGSRCTDSKDLARIKH